MNIKKLEEFLQKAKKHVISQQAKAKAIGDDKATCYYDGMFDMIEWFENKKRRVK